MSKMRSPDTTTTTTTPQRIELHESQMKYTLRNTGATNSVWWHSDLAITDTSITNKTAAQLRTAGCSELKVGELNNITSYNLWVKVVYPSDGGASTIDIEPGVVGGNVTLEGDLQIGAVELKDDATDSRASVEAANTARTTATKVLAAQNVDAAGLVQAAHNDSGHGSAAATTKRVVPSVDVDLDKVTQSKAHTHTTSGTAESIAGDTAFSAGATVMIVGIDTWVAVGDDAAQAQGGDVKFPAGVPFTVQLDGTEVAFHLDAATGGSVSIHQIS